MSNQFHVLFKHLIGGILDPGAGHIGLREEVNIAASDGKIGDRVTFECVAFQRSDGDGVDIAERILNGATWVIAVPILTIDKHVIRTGRNGKETAGNC